MIIGSKVVIRIITSIRIVGRIGIISASGSVIPVPIAN